MENDLLKKLMDDAVDALSNKIMDDLFKEPKAKEKPKPLSKAEKLKAIRPESKWLKSKRRCKVCGHKSIFHFYDSECGYECLVEGCRCEK